jgi:hypothetical protein
VQEKFVVKPTESEHTTQHREKVFYKTEAWFSSYDLLKIKEESVCLELQRRMLARLKCDFLTGWKIPRVVGTKVN